LYAWLTIIIALCGSVKVAENWHVEAYVFYGENASWIGWNAVQLCSLG
jgi:hypothetical protein